MGAEAFFGEVRRKDSADAETQQKICKLVAEAFNDEFTPGARKQDKLIDTSLGPVSICRMISELVHSLSFGINAELLEVKASVKRILQNVEVLDGVMRSMHSKIIAQLKDCNKEGADKKIANFEEAYNRAEKERTRQMLMLRNFVDVTLSPAEKELEIAMNDASDTNKLIKKLKLTPGTGEFSDTLAMAISGIGTVAAVSARVDKALKKIGMSVKDYLESGSLKELENELDNKLMDGKVEIKDVAEFLKSVQTLKENFYRRSELDFNFFNGKNNAEMESEISGGYGCYRGGKDEERKTIIDSRVEKYKAERKIVVQEFLKKSARGYDDFLKAVVKIVNGNT